MNRSYDPSVIIIAGILATCCATASVAAEAKTIPVPDAAKDMTFESLRGVQYCEVWIITESPETAISGDYYNTSDLNNTADKLDTCPPSLWAKVDAEALKSEYGALTVFKNGPRGWTMDSVTIPVGPVETFDGIQTRWWGEGVLPKGAKFQDGLKPYAPLKSHRKSTFTFDRGKPVYMLVDPEGTPWIMQAFGRIIDPAMQYDKLDELGAKLKLPTGWSYRVVDLDKDLVISTPRGYNWIVQDDLGNTYDACKEGACNYMPYVVDGGARHHAQGRYDPATAGYVVAPGDDLIEIGRRFGASVAELKEWNALASDTIDAGQTLKVAADTSVSAATPANRYEMTTDIAPGVATPDTLDTSIGTLHLRDGVPSAESTETIYDNLDRSRALQAYLLGIPIVNQASMRESLAEFGPVNQTDVIWEELVDSKTVELTANDNTVYSFIWLDTKDGPLVVEVPPKVLGLIDDFWYKWVADVGITGPDKGKGGKYLILPPGYDGEVPEGYFVVRPSTYGIWMPFRSFLVDGSPKPGVELVKKNLKIYRLGDESNPPEIKFANASGIPSNFVFPGDYSFWELLSQVIQEEPSEGSDPTTLGLFASIGIQKGKPFEPDARMKAILEDAAKIGAATARAIAYRIRDNDAFVYTDSTWRKPFFGGYKFEVAPGVSNLDGAIFFYYIATGVTPAMAEKMVGKGSQYPWTPLDADGNPFDGAKTYKLHLPPNIPVKDFWSVIVYDTQTRSMLQTDQRFPSVSSQNQDLQVNADGSVDVWFAPEAPKGKASNWVQTIPGKGWFMILRLYGPLEPWFDQTWRPGEIELVQ